MVVLCAFLIYTPSYLVFGLFVLAAWYAMFGIKADQLELPVVGPLSRGQELAGMFIVTTILLAAVGAPEALLWALLTAFLGICLHAGLRSTSMPASSAYRPVAVSENDGLLTGGKVDPF